MRGVSRPVPRDEIDASQLCERIDDERIERERGVRERRLYGGELVADIGLGAFRTHPVRGSCYQDGG